MRPVIDACKFNIDQFYRIRYQGQLLNYNDMMRRGGQADVVYEEQKYMSFNQLYGQRSRKLWLFFSPTAPPFIPSIWIQTGVYIRFSIQYLLLPI